jgi:hypothetical protein
MFPKRVQPAPMHFRPTQAVLENGNTMCRTIGALTRHISDRLYDVAPKEVLQKYGWYTRRFVNPDHSHLFDWWQFHLHHRLLQKHWAYTHNPIFPGQTERRRQPRSRQRHIFTLSTTAARPCIDHLSTASRVRHVRRVHPYWVRSILEKWRRGASRASGCSCNAQCVCLIA